MSRLSGGGEVNKVSEERNPATDLQTVSEANLINLVHSPSPSLTVQGLAQMARYYITALAESQTLVRVMGEALETVLAAYLDIAPYHACCGPARAHGTVDCRPGECGEDCYYSRAARDARRVVEAAREWGEVRKLIDAHADAEACVRIGPARDTLRSALAALEEVD